MSSEPTTLAHLLAQLRRVALIARLPRDLTIQALLEIGDALLAAPLFVVEVAVDVADGTATIAEFHQRYGEHLLVGAAEVTTLAQLQAAQEAGAAFFALPQLDAKLLRFAREHQLFCLPHVTTPVAAQLAHLEGCPAVSSPAELVTTGSWPLGVSMIASEVTAEATVAACRAAGAIGVRLQASLFPTPEWSHAAIITTARRLRRQWEGSVYTNPQARSIHPPERGPKRP
ncbi:MAG: hypothetical protein KF832_18275 [Caldilineaceae bacterium]|nr:hypothetical protein [Caldilineaceae bacterium]